MFLESVFNILGVDGKRDYDKMDDIFEVIKGLKYPEVPTANSVFETMYRELIEEGDFSRGLAPSQKRFNPGKHNPNSDSVATPFDLEIIDPESMTELIDVLIHCSEGSSNVF